jgi:hypothetical protein
MGIPTKVIITVAIIVGVAAGTGLLVAGILIAVGDYGEEAVFTMAAGSALLAASLASLIAHLAASATSTAADRR